MAPTKSHTYEKERGKVAERGREATKRGHLPAINHKDTPIPDNEGNDETTPLRTEIRGANE